MVKNDWKKKKNITSSETKSSNSDNNRKIKENKNKKNEEKKNPNKLKQDTHTKKFFFSSHFHQGLDKASTVCPSPSCS